MKALLISSIILFFSISIAFSQTNLLRNASFDSIASIQSTWATSYTQFDENMPFWSSPTLGSPDIFSNNIQYSWQYRVQGLGKDTAHSRPNMVGITTFVHETCIKEHKREYIHTRLLQPLEKGKTYQISFWAKSPHRTLRSSHLGVLFSKYDFFNRTIRRIPAKPQIEIDTILNLEIWTKIVLTFTSDSDYDFFTLGNFASNKQTSFSAISKKPSWFAYYYIDDLSIVELKPQKPEPPVMSATSPTPLDNIYFEFDKAVLLPSSHPELDKLISTLQNNPNAKVEIHGHTDNDGGDDYNQKLSEARAQAVVDYLIAHGIDEKRLSAKGFGEQMPLSDAKDKNRRVAFILK